MNIGNKEQISNTFNLTTTAAALLAASDKNAAAFINCESKTWESRNSNTISEHANFSSEQNTGVLNSSKKKQNFNKTVEGTKSSLVEKKLALNQRMIDSRGQIRLTSQKRSSKSSYSCSQKRQRDALAGNQNTATTAGGKQKNTIDSNTIYIADGLRPDSTDIRKINLSQSKLQTNQ